MATPRARGGSSLTILPPINRSPLVCCSSPQMTRRNVVLPQPEGPSKTMNSPFGTSRLMPLTAETTPNCLTIFLAETADMNPPANSTVPPSRAACSRGRGVTIQTRPVAAGPRLAWVLFRSGLFEPLLVNGFALLRGPLDRFLGGHLARRRLGHHVADHEIVVDLVDGRPRRPRVAGRCGPRLGILKD